jgi:hypothetical protein
MRKQEKIGHFTAFLGLNEAVVSEIEKRYFPQLISGNEFLAEEYQWLTSEKARKYKKRIAESEGLPADEIMWVSKDGKHLGCFPYYEQRRVLNYIVDCLDEDNVEQFNSRDEIMKLFFKSHFDGRLLSIAGLIEKSFGEEAFRVIGMMDERENSARLVMDYLMKRRRKNRTDNLNL